MAYPAEFREAAVQKVLRPGSPGIEAVARQLNINSNTLTRWRNNYLGRGNMRKGKRPKDWTSEQKLKAIMETSGLEAAAVGEYCRGNGIHASQLELWKEQCLASMRRGPKVDPERRSLENENKSLKKELRRKEKALAEAAALLVLKKKAEALWGDLEDEDS